MEVDHFARKFQTEGGVAHQPQLVSENWSDCPFVWYQNIRSALFGFVIIHACDRQTGADGRTDRQNFDSQDRASVAARAVKLESHVNRLSVTSSATLTACLLAAAGESSKGVGSCNIVYVARLTNGAGGRRVWGGGKGYNRVRAANEMSRQNRA